MAKRETAAEAIERKAAQARRRAARKVAAERQRVGDVASVTGATRERAAKTAVKGAAWHGRREATPRIGGDLPRVIRDLFDRGQIDAVHVKAAERYVADYHYGMCAPSMTQKWERGVDGGSKGDQSEARFDAKERWIEADACLGMVRPVVFGVLLGGVTLENADGPGQRYAAMGSRRAGNGAALYLGLDAMARRYGLKEPS